MRWLGANGFGSWEGAEMLKSLVVAQPMLECWTCCTSGVCMGFDKGRECKVGLG